MLIRLVKTLSIMGLIVVGVYFFSYQLQMLLGGIVRHIGRRSQRADYNLRRYVFFHRGSLLAKFYTWENEQLISLGLRRNGITVMGALLFYAVVTFLAWFFMCLFTQDFDILLLPILYFLNVVIVRVAVSGKILKREAAVMNAEDIIVPQIRDVVMNAIRSQLNNFEPVVSFEFHIFVSDVTDRGMSFRDAMIILSDSLGPVFYDFAQKAIYFESSGDTSHLDLFSDILDTNRDRRESRALNAVVFIASRISFMVSAGITLGYLLFILATNSNVLNLFFYTKVGNRMLWFIILTIIAVLCYIQILSGRSIDDYD